MVRSGSVSAVPPSASSCTAWTMISTWAPQGASVRFESWMEAPWLSKIFLTMGRPSPVPVSLVVTYGSKACERIVSLNPEPLSFRRKRMA